MIEAATTARPRCAGRMRIGALGAGWIGRQRLQSLVAGCDVDLVAVADPDPEARAAARMLAPHAAGVSELEELLDRELDGIVIATPSALHADQAIAALRTGAAVFCQKPLARSAAETNRVIDTARREDLLLGIDLSYRHTTAAQAIHDALAHGDIGEVHAVELVFHNAYGPDKPWFTRRSEAGGGCLIDLGTHLLDLCLWLTGGGSATVQAAHMTCRGRTVDAGSEEVEDFALAQLDTESGVVVRLACSWFLPAGRDCVFEVTAYGTEGALTMRNVQGSFYDFVAEHQRATTSRRIADPSPDWGAGAIQRWGRRLVQGTRFDPDVQRLTGLASIIDQIYAAA